MLNKKLIFKIFGLGAIVSSLFITPLTVNASDTDSDLSANIQEVEEFCEIYNVEMSNDPDFVNEVRAMLRERNEKNVNGITPYSSDSNPLKKSRYIPLGSYADIIWTNNPISPFNHVGLYTKTDKITEALDNGVKTRTVGKNMQEYPFNIYMVTTAAGGNTRYLLSDRQEVASWAVAQVGKKYDANFANNKLNTTANNEKMNCSELVWKSWKFKKGVDLDSNGGPGVYPNNIKDSNRTRLVSSSL